jgi:hypothetical protein
MEVSGQLHDPPLYPLGKNPQYSLDRRLATVVSLQKFSTYFSFSLCKLHVSQYTKTIIFIVVLYGCETSSFTPKEEKRWRVFENRVLWRIFGTKRKWWKARENCIVRSFITCMLHQILLG